jgi:hypothetical protein
MARIADAEHDPAVVVGVRAPEILHPVEKVARSARAPPAVRVSKGESVIGSLENGVCLRSRA